MRTFKFQKRNPRKYAPLATFKLKMIPIVNAFLTIHHKESIEIPIYMQIFVSHLLDVTSNIIINR